MTACTLTKGSEQTVASLHGLCAASASDPCCCRWPRPRTETPGLAAAAFLWPICLASWARPARRQHCWVLDILESLPDHADSAMSMRVRHAAAQLGSPVLQVPAQLTGGQARAHLEEVQVGDAQQAGQGVGVVGHGARGQLSIGGVVDGEVGPEVGAVGQGGGQRQEGSHRLGALTWGSADAPGLWPGVRAAAVCRACCCLAC